MLRSGFYLAPPRPLPYLLNDLFQGPVLILQGVHDPLNNAKGRADTLEAVLENAKKVLLEAGHCPHDEVPELVNEAIHDFVQSLPAGAQRAGAELNGPPPGQNGSYAGVGNGRAPESMRVPVSQPAQAR